MEIHNHAGDNVVSSKKRRRKKKASIKTVDQMDVNLEESKIKDCRVANNNLETNLLETNGNLGQEIDGGITENEGSQSTNQNKMDIKSIFNLVEGTANAKRKRKRNKVKRKAGNNDEVECRDRSNTISCIQVSDKSLRQENDDTIAKNEDVLHINQDMTSIELTFNLTEGNVNAKRKMRNKIRSKAENKVEVQSVDHSMSKLQVSVKELRQEMCDKLAENVDAQHTNQDKMDIESTVNLEGNVNAKRNRKKRNRIKRKTGNKDALQSMDQSNSLSNLQSDNKLGQEICDQLAENVDTQHPNQDKMDIESTVNLDEGNVSAKRNRKRNRIKRKTGNKDELQSVDQSNSSSNLQSDNKLRQEICDKLAENVDAQHTNQNKMDIQSTVNLDEGNVSAKRNRKRNGVKKKTRNKDELQGMDQSNSSSRLQSDNKLKHEICDKLAENVDAQHINQNKIDIESTVNLDEGNVSAKRNRKRNRIKRKTGNKDELESMDQSNASSNLQSDNKLRHEICDKLTENVDAQHTNQNEMDIESTVNLDEGNVSTKRNGKKRNRKRNRIKRETGNKDELQSMDQSTSLSNLQSDNNLRQEIDDKLTENEDVQSIDQKKMDIESTYKETTSLGPSDVKEAKCLSKDLGEYPSRPPTTTYRRKLLVLDLNGLLAYIVMPAPKDRRGDIHILGRAVFKRPFCDDFLKFCFQNFDVGIWSSRAKKVIDRVVDYLLGNLKQKLLFCWDMSHSTQTGFKTLENIHKPLVCKELKKIWKEDGPDFSWKKGQYDESNTLLLDDSPYKALLNPLHTAIFPHSYHYEDKDDNSLGPGGDLRVYLEGLLKSENVREYVEYHPFGQSAINETNVSWQFYSRVFQKMSNNMRAKKPTLSLTSSQNLTAPPQDKVVDSNTTTLLTQQLLL